MIMDNTKTTPDYLFESSWEVCNKVGGIYTVLSTKAHTLQQTFKDKRSEERRVGKTQKLQILKKIKSYLLIGRSTLSRMTI